MKLPKYARNFYFLTGLFFLVWMLFIDSNDVISQYKLGSAVRELETRKEYYIKNINRLTDDYEQRTKSQQYLEKFAREEYYMKKENEDIYVIVEED